MGQLSPQPGSAPSRLGRYELGRVLGQGAMGVVYDALDPRLNRRVAIKTILRSALGDPDTLSDTSARFVREAQAIARLSHPHIVTVFDFGEEGEVAYFVMEYVAGRELKSYFDAGERFPLDVAVRIVCELLSALAFAHRAGIVHRDVKPANVMLDEALRVKLTDFGVARMTDAGSDRTLAGTLVGTPSYMSPEQIQGQAVGSRTDLFAAGIILYQFLTGAKPFPGPGIWAIQKQIVQDMARPPSEQNPAIDARLDAVVWRALAKNPAERFADAMEFSEALLSASGLGHAAGRLAHAPRPASPQGPGAPEPDLSATRPAPDIATRPVPDLSATRPAPDLSATRPAPDVATRPLAPPARADAAAPPADDTATLVVAAAPADASATLPEAAARVVAADASAADTIALDTAARTAMPAPARPGVTAAAPPQAVPAPIAPAQESREPNVPAAARPPARLWALAGLALALAGGAIYALMPRAPAPVPPPATPVAKTPELVAPAAPLPPPAAKAAEPVAAPASSEAAASGAAEAAGAAAAVPAQPPAQAAPAPAATQAAPGAKPGAGTQADTTAAKPAAASGRAPPVERAKSPPDPVSAQAAAGSTTARKRASGAELPAAEPSGATKARCSDLLQRFQVGEDLSADDMNVLRKECRK